MDLRQQVERLILINSTGPVTSVALSAPTGFSVTGSPGTGAVSLGLIYSGTFPGTSMPALTGDVTSSAGSTVTTVAQINGNLLGNTTPTANNIFCADGTSWGKKQVGGDISAVVGGITAVFTINKINGGGIWNLLSCAADQTVTNNATLQNDAILTFAMAASTNYRIRGQIWLDGTSLTAAMKYAFSGPASPTLVRFERWDNANGGAATGRAIDLAIPGSTTLVTGTADTGEMLRFEGIVQNGVNSGTFVFQFAQATATAAQSVVRRAGSYMEWAVA